MKTLSEIQNMIDERERNGARASFTCDAQTLSDLASMNQTQNVDMLAPPIAPGRPWRLMGRDLIVVDGKQPLKVTP